MLHKLVQSIPIVLLLATGTMAQNQREQGSSIQERALQLEPLIVESAKRYGIDARVLTVMCFIESRYRADAVSPKGARGLMQFMPQTAVRYGLKNPHDPKEAIDAAARYLRDLLARFNGRVDLALAAYNAGEGTVESFLTGRPLVLPTGKVINGRGLVTGGIPPYPETRAYVKAITSLAAARPMLPRSSAVHVEPLHRIKNRDFTLDATIDDAPVEIEIKRTPNSSFIEIE